MTLKNLLKKVNIIKHDVDMDVEVAGICYDSRKVKSGDVFVAIRGYDSDGHHFIESAMENGAVCVIAEEKPNVALPYILVENTRVALAEISAAWFDYPADKLVTIGVTGTNGKTTVTNIIKTIIEKCTGEKCGLIGTNQNLIGNIELPAALTTPDSYCIFEMMAKMVSEGCRYAVMEVSSHALIMHRTHGIIFDVAVFTNLTPEHLDFHGTMEDYAEAKSRLFKQCRAAAINIDDPYAKYMTEGAECSFLTYAMNDAMADLVAKDIRLTDDKVQFCAVAIGSIDRVELGIPGLFSVYNALSAISAAILLGIDINDIIDALRDCIGVKGRAERVPVETDYTVIIDYAHTPLALKNIIMAVRGFAEGRVLTLFGCGGDRDKTKRSIMGEIAAEHSDFVIITSDNPRTEDPSVIIDEILIGINKLNLPHIRIDDRRAAIHYALDMAKTGDVLILAGKGHETYQILGKEKVHFDEREIVGEYLR